MSKPGLALTPPHREPPRLRLYRVRTMRAILQVCRVKARVRSPRPFQNRRLETETRGG